MWKAEPPSHGSIYNGRADLSRFGRVRWPLNDSVYLFSRYAIKPGDLHPAHAVSRQCAHAAHVGGWYYTGVLPGRLFPPFLLLIGRHLCFRTRHRRGCDGQDTGLPPSAMPSGRGTGRGGGKFRRTGLLRLFKQVFGRPASSNALLTITAIVCRVPIRHRTLPQRKLVSELVSIGLLPSNGDLETRHSRV